MSCQCSLLVLGSEIIIILSTFQTVQVILRVLQNVQKIAHNSFPQAFFVDTLQLETYLLDSYYHTWKNQLFIRFPYIS